MAKHYLPALVPPGAAQVPEAVEIKRLDKAEAPINAFERTLGGREALVDALALDDSAPIVQLTNALCDPSFDKQSLASIALKVGLTFSDLLRAYRNAALAKAHIVAVNKLVTKIPEIIDDIVKRSAPYDEPCERCNGKGVITRMGRATKTGGPTEPIEIACSTCHGVGTIHRLPDLDRQRLVLELSELLKTPGSSRTVMQQINMPAASDVPGSTRVGPGALEQMQQAVTSILYASKTVIDLDPVPPTEDT